MLVHEQVNRVSSEACYLPAVAAGARAALITTARVGAVLSEVADYINVRRMSKFSV